MDYTKVGYDWLKAREKEIENEIEALQTELNQVENEIFYRKNPECRTLKNK